MKILITGGTGFIGSALIKHMLAKAADATVKITLMARHPTKAQRQLPNNTNLTFIRQINELDDYAHFDTVINLAGEGIADKRWTPRRKQALEASRITLTEQLVDWMRRAKYKPNLFISGSAVGWYGNQGSNCLDEQSAAHDEYVHQLCNRWELAAKAAEPLAVRVCIIRTGVVIGKSGGFLKRLLPIFSLGAGGPLGQGTQYLSWISLDDVIQGIIYLINNPSLSGTFNFTAPNPVTNNEFTQTFARVLGRPALFRVPALVIKLATGEMSTLLLDGQRVLPSRLMQAGYSFVHPTLSDALKATII